MKATAKDWEIEFLYKSAMIKDKTIQALSETIAMMEKRIREMEKKLSHKHRID